MEPPVLEFSDFGFEESSYNRGNKTWMASTLLKAVHDQELEPFEYPVAVYDLSINHFSLPCADSFIYHMKRVLNADYDMHPIILDDLGQVCDGNHRLCHAILDGKRSVLAYRLLTMPEPDFVDSSDE